MPPHVAGRPAFGPDHATLDPTPGRPTGRGPGRDRAADPAACVARQFDDLLGPEGQGGPRRSESLLRLVWEVAADGMRLTDRDGTVVMANPAYCRMVGRRPEEVVGRSFADAYAPAGRADILAKHRARFATPADHPWETHVELADGRRVSFEVNHALLDLPGAPPLLLTTARDVTARVRAEDALRDREELLRGVIDRIPCGVFWKDRDSVFLGCNDLFARNHGLPGPAAVVGKTDRELGTAPAEAAAFRAVDRRVVETGEGVLDAEEVLTRPDGARLTLLTSKVPLRNAAGGVAGVLGVYQDVTARRRLEDQLRQAQKLEAVGRLAGGVAHDFNNLVTVITGFSDLALDALPPGHPARAMVEEIREAGDRAADLTRQLLAYGRKQFLQPRVLDLGGLVGDLGGMLRRVIGEDVTLALRTRPVRVSADPGQLSQVVMNLAVNARDAMPRGGRLDVRVRETEAAGGPGGPAPGRYALLEVADTGCGMTDAVRARVFEPFFTTKEVGKGTGLGLATVYGIVTQSGGHVEVQSEVGRGTTFRVYLPAAAGDAAEPAAGEAAAGAAGAGGETVLLVEDDDRVRALAMRALQLAGYAVVDAASGEQALQAVAAFGLDVDLLVTDVVMPGVGGRELADRLTAARPGLPVLFMSGYTDDAVLRHGVEQDAVHFLPKPYTPAALARKVRDVLDGR